MNFEMNTPDGSNINVAPVRGVLFDIDDTLVDLRSAAIRGFLSMSASALGHVDPKRLAEIAADFADDGAGAYERYMSGELTFLGQRQVRLQRAYALADAYAPDGEEYALWASAYEAKVRESWKPFADVETCLQQLTDWGIPYGAVSNNVESYQREKLEISGLAGFSCVIGSDTAGAPKPAAAPFLEGCRQLGSAPEETLYIGDNPINDYQGAIQAGLQAILLDRASVHTEFSGQKIQELTACIVQSSRNSADFA